MNKILIKMLIGIIFLLKKIIGKRKRNLSDGIDSLRQTYFYF